MSMIYDIEPGLKALSYGHDPVRPLVVLFGIGLCNSMSSASSVLVAQTDQGKGKVKGGSRNHNQSELIDRIEFH
jgi:hypothetical protein